MSVYILPVLFLLLFVYCVFKRINTYDHFVKGAKGAIQLVVDIFPFIASILIAVALLRVSGITDFLGNILSPFFRILLYAIPVALFCSLVGTILACLVCKIM